MNNILIELNENQEKIIVIDTGYSYLELSKDEAFNIANKIITLITEDNLNKLKETDAYIGSKL